MVAGPWVESIDLGDEDPAMGIRVISGPGIIQPVIYRSCAPAWDITNAHPPSCAVAKVGTTIFYYTGEPVPGGAEYRLLLPSGAPILAALHNQCPACDAGAIEHLLSDSASNLELISHLEPSRTRVYAEAPGVAQGFARGQRMLLDRLTWHCAPADLPCCVWPPRQAYMIDMSLLFAWGQVLQ